MKVCSVRSLCVAAATSVLVAGCAVLPTPDPRDPGAVKAAPVVLRVCSVDGDGAHLVVGDQVELATSGLGRLRIRHLPSAQNQARVWNGGEAARVRDAVLVEMIDPRGQQANNRRFVPVGRFAVQVDGMDGHAKFDFLASKVTQRVADHGYRECIADVGDDEVLIRGVEDSDRHGGVAHLR